MAQTLKPEIKKAILTAARKRFRKFGIKRTTMNEIAEDADIAVGNLYRYFPSKIDIVAACAEEFAAKHREAIDQIQSTELDWFDKLEKYVLMRFAASQEVRTGTSFAAEIARAVIEAKPDRLTDESTLFMNVVRSMLQHAQNTGRFEGFDINLESEIFAYTVSYFFPISGNVVIVEPTEDRLRQVLQWFRRIWTSKK